MFGFATNIDKVLVLQQRHAKQQEQASKTKVKLDAQFKRVADACRPACLSAVEAHNKGASILIDAKSVRLNIDLKGLTLGMGVSLKYPNGHELNDGDLDSGDLEKIEVVLKPFLEAEFKNQGIPFTFTRIRVPNEYFMR